MIAQNLQQRKISNWSNTNFSYSVVAFPETVEVIRSLIQKAKLDRKKVIGRGAGQSYSDQALNNEHIVIDMSKMNQILEWNKTSGILRVQAGATYEDVLSCCVKDGWIFAVIPGTRYVTMGGALANNVHGKNSYARGNFGEWVQEFKIVLASGEHLICSNKINNDLFSAVIGGAGLFGIVTEIILQLVHIPSAYLSVKKTIAPSLDKLMDELDKVSKENDFAIAQVDCFPKTVGLGRGTIHAGNFISSNMDIKDMEVMQNISQRMFGIFPKKWIPIVGKYILNDYIMRWISRFKYYFDKKTNLKNTYKEDIFHFTFLLDQVPGWKKIFRYGFFEYEPLIPKEKARIVISQLIVLTHRYGMPAYLSAIKIHRKDNFLLSYSMDGYSFAMDIPRRPKEKEKQDELFRKMNKIVLQACGIVYLAKDANLTADEFRQMYKNIGKFQMLKKKYDPDELFQSDMYRRIFQSNK